MDPLGAQLDDDVAFEGCEHAHGIIVTVGPWPESRHRNGCFILALSSMKILPPSMSQRDAE